MSTVAKPVGRPPILGPEPVTLRVQVAREMAERIDATAGTRSEAVRRLLALGLGLGG